MHPPSRVRRILKWTGVGSCMLIAALWLICLKYIITIASSSCELTLADNFFLLVLDFELGINWRVEANVHDLKGIGFELPRLVWVGRNGDVAWALIPYWLPLLLTAIPTAWLWHRDRRRIRPGCCLRCGYDLTGNTSGVCSECGLAKPSPATV